MSLSISEEYQQQKECEKKRKEERKKKELKVITDKNFIYTPNKIFLNDKTK